MATRSGGTRQPRRDAVVVDIKAKAQRTSSARRSWRSWVRLAGFGQCTNAISVQWYTTFARCSAGVLRLYWRARPADGHLGVLRECDGRRDRDQRCAARAGLRAAATADHAAAVPSGPGCPAAPAFRTDARAPRCGEHRGRQQQRRHEPRRWRRTSRRRRL